ncbi:MAG: hypothetical protein J6L61_00795 [Ruminiclostridium sp.]|nr:hypothetical protein [Ruminiclostridium sp.]
MEWFNLTGLIFVVVLLIPNIIYAATNKDGFADKFHNKLVETGEQIGRFGCFILMFIQLPYVTLGYIYDGAQTLYLILGIVLLALYCGGWIVFRKKNSVAKALTLSILPSVLFLESGILTLNIPLVVLSVVFAICHITISYKNTVE